MSMAACNANQQDGPAFFGCVASTPACAPGRCHPRRAATGQAPSGRDTRWRPAACTPSHANLSTSLCRLQSPPSCARPCCERARETLRLRTTVDGRGPCAGYMVSHTHPTRRFAPSSAK